MIIVTIYDDIMTITTTINLPTSISKGLLFIYLLTRIAINYFQPYHLLVWLLQSHIRVIFQAPLTSNRIIPLFLLEPISIAINIPITIPITISITIPISIPKGLLLLLFPTVSSPIITERPLGFPSGIIR